MDSHEICEKVTEILRKTNDGDDLSPRHLKILEMALNGFLNENGYKIFNDIYERVMNDKYVGWFHGIEHLSCDHGGYVYWRGVWVEHYSFFDYEEEASAAHELAELCKKLEQEGIEVNARSVWEAYGKE